MNFINLLWISEAIPVNMGFTCLRFQPKEFLSRNHSQTDLLCTKRRIRFTYFHQRDLTKEILFKYINQVKSSLYGKNKPFPTN